jgi:hypothetical protein
MTPVSKMALLDMLLGLRCDTVIVHVSEFNGVVTRLTAMGVNFDQDLLAAILLRGLPPTFEIFTQTVKHREKLPSLNELIGMLQVEDQARRHNQGSQSYNAESDHVSRCDKCGKKGHNEEKCWTAHPEQKPTCKICDRQGHVARKCPDKRQGNMATSNNIGELSVDTYRFDQIMPISL